MAEKAQNSIVYAFILISAIISSIMVGGKAIGKNIAVKKSDEIIFIVGSILNKFKKGKN